MSVGLPGCVRPRGMLRESEREGEREESLPSHAASASPPRECPRPLRGLKSPAILGLFPLRLLKRQQGKQGASHLVIAEL